uniref:Transposase n=1 Tax=Ascaris lumbricoides TaxID=6252 RepID=A0A0M3HMG6_ASCLU
MFRAVFDYQNEHHLRPLNRTQLARANRKLMSRTVVLLSNQTR